jgi:hypothetical protein
LAHRRQAKSNESTQNQKKARRAAGKPNRKRARREPKDDHPQIKSEEIWFYLAADQAASRGAGRCVSEEGARGEAEAAMWRFRGGRRRWLAGRLQVPRRAPRSGWPAEGLWGYQGGQMGQKLPLCAQLGTTRSREDESNEVSEGEVGSKRTSAGCNEVHHIWWGGLISRLLTTEQAIAAPTNTFSCVFF